MKMIIKRILDNQRFVISQIKNARERRTLEGELVIPLYEFKEYEWKSPRELVLTFGDLESGSKMLEVKYIRLNDLSCYKGKLTPKQISTLRIGNINIGKATGGFFYSPAYQYNKDDELILDIDEKKLNKASERLEKKLQSFPSEEVVEGKKAIPKLYLKEDGELYRISENGKKLVYPMRTRGRRYRIVYFLANRKNFIPTQEIADEYGVNAGTIRKTIGQIRQNIKNSCGISGDEVIESRIGEGYRIKCVEIKEETED